MGNQSESHQYIELSERSLSRPAAETRVFDALRELKVANSKSQLRRNGFELNGVHVDFHGLVAETMKSGVIPTLDWLLYTTRSGHIAFASSVSATGPSLMIGQGPRQSDRMRGPGYITNDVVSDILDDVLQYRVQAAELSRFVDEGYKPCFRAFRSYLSAGITAVDAFLNRRAWNAVNVPSSSLSPADLAVLKNVRQPLDSKFRKWLPLLAGGKAVNETGDAWAAFQALKQARNGFVHVNEPDYLFNLDDAVGALNLCRLGVGQLLVEASLLVGAPPLPNMYAVCHAPEASFVALPPESTTI